MRKRGSIIFLCDWVKGTWIEMFFKVRCPFQRRELETKLHWGDRESAQAAELTREEWKQCQTFFAFNDGLKVIVDCHLLAQFGKRALNQPLPTHTRLSKCLCLSVIGGRGGSETGGTRGTRAGPQSLKQRYKGVWVCSANTHAVLTSTHRGSFGWPKPRSFSLLEDIYGSHVLRGFELSRPET